jgi:hypothetical protein
MLTILDAIRDSKLFGRLFQPRESWAAWLAFRETPKSVSLSQDFNLRESPFSPRRGPCVEGRGGGAVPRESPRGEEIPGVGI